MAKFNFDKLSNLVSRDVLLKWPLLASPVFGLVLVNVIWGATPVVAKYTLNEFPVSVLGFLRFFIAFLLLLPFIVFGKHKTKIEKVDVPIFVVTGFFIVALHILLFFEGVKLTYAIDASTLSLTVPLLSVLAGWWFLKEKVYLVNLIGIGVGLLGALAVTDIPLVVFGLGSLKSSLGNILILLSCVSFVVGAVFSRKLMAKYSVLVVIEAIFLVGALCFLPLALFETVVVWGWWNDVTLVGIFGVFFMTLLSSISAYFLFEWGMKKLGIIKADLFQYIQPAVSATLAVPLLGERISFSFIIGTCLVVLGVYLGTIKKSEHHHRSLRASRI